MPTQSNSASVSHRRLAGMAPATFCAFIFAFLAVLGIGARPRLTDTITIGKLAATTAQVTPTPRTKAVYLRITPLGIEPAQLTLSAGEYLVAIDNDSSFNIADIKIDREGGSRLGNAQLPSGRRKWRGYVNLTPGRFILTDPGNAKRVCRITITNQ